MFKCRVELRVYEEPVLPNFRCVYILRRQLQKFIVQATSKNTYPYIHIFVRISSSYNSHIEAFSIERMANH